jgi:hypothetical protein
MSAGNGQGEVILRLEDIHLSLLKAISGLLKIEDGKVTERTIKSDGQRIENGSAVTIGSQPPGSGGRLDAPSAMGRLVIQRPDPPTVHDGNLKSQGVRGRNTWSSSWL